MKLLVAELETLGLLDVTTYIQSGNIVFRCPSGRAAILSAEIGAVINAKFGFDPYVAVLSAEDLAASAIANPFPEAATEQGGKTLHLFFLAKALASIDGDRLEAVRRRSERWQIKGTVFYLHTPEGFGDSKLATQVERILGTTATARNWRTVCTLLALAGDLDH